jgi:GNAT superfamily N-acetyltransferase
MATVEPLVPGDFDAFHGVYVASYARDFDCPWLAVEKRVNLTADAYNDAFVWVARDVSSPGGVDEIVGGATAILPLQDNREFAFLDVFVHPDHRRMGHGSALMDALLADGYTLQTWRGPCPDDLLDEYAELRRMLVAEAPKGEAGLEPEHWDAARVRKDEADLAEVARVMQVMVARAPSGDLAGHTQLAFPSSDEVYQWDTLVRPAHRGLGLGLALKTAMMHATADLLEGRRRIITENAASNEHMIAVNEALGYRQVAWIGEYVRQL